MKLIYVKMTFKNTLRKKGKVELIFLTVQDEDSCMIPLEKTFYLTLVTKNLKNCSLKILGLLDNLS